MGYLTKRRPHQVGGRKNSSSEGGVLKNPWDAWNENSHLRKRAQLSACHGGKFGWMEGESEGLQRVGRRKKGTSTPVKKRIPPELLKEKTALGR